jgi:hypothetical protein
VFGSGICLTQTTTFMSASVFVASGSKL